MKHSVVTDPASATPVGGAIVVCSLAQAQRWAGAPPNADPGSAPALGRRLRREGARAACIVGVAHGQGRTLTWLDTEHARGWLAPGSGGVPATDPARFATNVSEALAKGFVPADAAVIAAMAYGDEGGAFIHDPRGLPLLSWGEAARFAAPRAARGLPLGLYPLVDSADRLQTVLDAGVRTVQLRMKTPAAPDAAWHAALRDDVRRAIDACERAGAQLYVNDHWRLALELGAYGVHLGQEDLAALSDADVATLAGGAIALGVSSHSLWELCRAHAVAPRYIACGPVWPTLTKDMPWIAQGMENLGWWCRMAPAPVVAIGGILGPEEVRQAARCGADGVCIVRGLGEHPSQTVPPLQAALDAGRREHETAPLPPRWPHPSLAQ